MMEKYISSAEESMDKSKLDKSNSNFENVRAIGPKSKRNSGIIIYDDVDVDKYMAPVEEELKKLGYSIESRAFIDKIINILDKLIQPGKFSKTIFFHILDYANLNRDSHILLYDFFRSFFTVYESMKKNRDSFVNEISKDTQRMDILKSKIIKWQKEEKVLESGLTNNSKIKIHAQVINAEQNADFDNNNAYPLKINFKIDHHHESLDLNSLNRKLSFKVDSMQLIDHPLRFYLKQEGSEIYIDKINPKDILDNPFVYKFSHQGMSFELKFLWMNSKINFYNKEITRLESKIEDDKENIQTLNNCIIHIEGIYSCILLINLFLETFKKFMKPSNDTNPKINAIEKPTSIGKQIEISQKIEDYVLHIIGKEVVVMDSIVFLLNKIMIPILILVFLARYELVTLLICIFLLAAEYKFISKRHLYQILLCLVGSILFDLVWIFCNLANWGITQQLDGSTTGSSIREFAIIMSILLTILKLVLAFCLWRLALEYKLHYINKQLKREPTNTSTIAMVVDYSKSEKKPAMKNSARPQLRSSANATAQIPMRMYDE